MKWLLSILIVLQMHAYDASFSTLIKEIYQVYHREEGDWCDQLRKDVEKIVQIYGREVSFVELQEGGIDSDYLDAMAIEYCKKHKDAYIATVWPTIDYSYEGVVYDILKEHCLEVVYHKKFVLKNGGPKALMRSIPEKLPHINKDFHCYFEPGRENYLLMCFVIRAKDLQSVIAAKNYFRRMVKLDPYCMHINDTHEQCLDLACKFLNKNSLHFLNYHKAEEFPNFNQLLPRYERFLKRRRISNDDVCVDGSVVLSAYGIRDSAMDFDFISTKYGPFSDIWPLDYHNSAWEKLGLSMDNAIYNPKNFFYYNRLKFINLNTLKEFKMKQGREKDLYDVVSIDALLL